jgi:hypothetical protein
MVGVFDRSSFLPFLSQRAFDQCRLPHESRSRSPKGTLICAKMWAMGINRVERCVIGGSRNAPPASTRNRKSLRRRPLRRCWRTFALAARTATIDDSVEMTQLLCILGTSSRGGLTHPLRLLSAKAQTAQEPGGLVRRRGPVA